MSYATPSNEPRPIVSQYMTLKVEVVSPDDSVAEVAKKIDSTGHDGFPVCVGRQVVGFVTARDLLLSSDNVSIFQVMSKDLLVAHPGMAVQDAARVILRSGIQKLPVIDDAGNLAGIISNSDVIRSQIERATPEKVGKLMRTLESIHEIKITQKRKKIFINLLIPTQKTVYADELEGRSYELSNGLAEPLVVIDCNDLLYLADGHHRTLAAHSLGIEKMDAYVLILDDSVELGMAKTAAKEGLTTIHDITIVDYARHPLVETTRRNN
ncbi:MAG: CBS pair associated ParBc domain-containing protein [Halobacteriales archaeon]